MPAPIPPVERYRPGRIYGEITVAREEFKPEADVLKKRELTWYEKYCKQVNKNFPFGKGAKFKEKYKSAIDFLGWELSAEEIASAGTFTMLASFFGSAIIGLIVFIFFGAMLSSMVAGFTPLIVIYIFVPLVALALYLSYYIQNYSLIAAESEKVKALTYIPEIVGYMIMSMKLVPNLEKAVEFSAEHGRGKIAKDLTKLMWDFQLGVYSSLSEGMDALTFRWGKFSEEFKSAMMMIRASVLETTEAKRFQVLDKTMTDVLSSIKIKMEDYARGLSQPSTMLFYLGVLLPLILIIVLPVGAIFSGSAISAPVVLFLLYNLTVPAIAFIYAHKVIGGKPPTYEPPKVPEGFPGIPSKGKMFLGKTQLPVRLVSAGILIFGVVIAVLISNGITFGEFHFGDTTLEIALAKANVSPEAFNQKKPMDQLLFIVGAGVSRTYLILIILISVSLAISAYYYYNNIYRRRVQLQAIKMESEFKDSLYVLASRLGENKPVEEALKYTQEFLPGQSISKEVFGKTIDNISLLGMPLSAAVFDPVYGSVKDNPSPLIKSGMKLLVDSVQLGVDVAGRTLISLSMQLRNSEEVTKLLSNLVRDITSMMATMAIFIAPMVLGITTALQKIVITTMASILKSGTLERLGESQVMEGMGLGLGKTTQTFLQPEGFAQMTTPELFLIIVGIYVIEMIFIMMYFTVRIQEDNPLLMKISIAKALPIAVTIFAVAVIAANQITALSLGGAAGP